MLQKMVMKMDQNALRCEKSLGKYGEVDIIDDDDDDGGGGGGGGGDEDEAFVKIGTELRESTTRRFSYSKYHGQRKHDNVSVARALNSHASNLVNVIDIGGEHVDLHESSNPADFSALLLGKHRSCQCIKVMIPRLAHKAD